MTLDHVIPRSQKGKSTWENVVTACRSCNLKKGSRPAAETGLRLMRAPKRPKFLFYSSFPYSAPTSHKKSWAKYLPHARS